jgi:uncharacterized membrane protein YkoI
MINKKIILSVIIVLLIGFAAAGYQVTTKTPGLWQPTTSTSQSQSSTGDSSQTSAGTSSQGDVQSQSTGTSSEGSQTGGSNVKISSSKAKAIAATYIEEDGASAGTPELKTIDGKSTYIVPVMMNGKQVGEIYIDPETGENLGGAGGAP